MFMRRNDELMLPFQKAFRRFAAKAIRFLRRDLARRKGLAQLVGDHIMLLRLAGVLAVCPLAEDKLLCRRLGRTFVAGHEAAARRFVRIENIVDARFQALCRRFPAADVNGDDACGRHVLILLSHKKKDGLHECRPSEVTVQTRSATGSRTRPPCVSTAIPLRMAVRRDC